MISNIVPLQNLFIAEYNNVVIGNFFVFRFVLSFLEFFVL